MVGRITTESLETVKPGVNIFTFLPSLPSAQFNFAPCIPGRIGGKHMHPPASEGWARSKSPEDLIFLFTEAVVIGWNPDTKEVTDIILVDSRVIPQMVRIPAEVAHLVLGLGNQSGMVFEHFSDTYAGANDPTVRYEVLPDTVQEVVNNYQEAMRDEAVSGPPFSLPLGTGNVLAGLSSGPGQGLGRLAEWAEGGEDRS